MKPKIAQPTSFQGIKTLNRALLNQLELSKPCTKSLAFLFFWEKYKLGICCAKVTQHGSTGAGNAIDPSLPVPGMYDKEVANASIPS